MNGSEWVREWAKRKKAELQPSLDMMEAGRLQSWEMRDGARVDTTEKGKALFRGMIAELERIIEGGRHDEAEGAST